MRQTGPHPNRSLCLLNPMFRNFRDRSPLYQAWALFVTLTAFYVLARVLTVEGLGPVDYAAMVFVHVSALLNYAFSSWAGDGRAPST